MRRLPEDARLNACPVSPLDGFSVQFCVAEDHKCPENDAVVYSARLDRIEAVAVAST